MKPVGPRFQLVSVFVLVCLCLPYHTVRAQEPALNLVLVTLDGVRWQEVFGGIDLKLIEAEILVQRASFQQCIHGRRADPVGISPSPRRYV